MRFSFLWFLSATAAPSNLPDSRRRMRKKYDKKKTTHVEQAALRNAAPRIQERLFFSAEELSGDIFQDSPFISTEEIFEVNLVSPSNQPTMGVDPAMKSSFSPTMIECKDDPFYISPANPKFGQSH